MGMTPADLEALAREYGEPAPCPESLSDESLLALAAAYAPNPSPACCVCGTPLRCYSYGSSGSRWECPSEAADYLRTLDPASLEHRAQSQTWTVPQPDPAVLALVAEHRQLRAENEGLRNEVNEALTRMLCYQDAQVRFMEGMVMAGEGRTECPCPKGSEAAKWWWNGAELARLRAEVARLRENEAGLQDQIEAWRGEAP